MRPSACVSVSGRGDAVEWQSKSTVAVGVEWQGVTRVSGRGRVESGRGEMRVSGRGGSRREWRERQEEMRL